jgi:ABC-2 type transport system permease protein
MYLNLTLKGFIKKEFKQSLRDPKMRVLLFIAPMIQLTLFGLAISNDVKNVQLAVVPSTTLAPLNEDPLLFEIYQKALSSKWFIEAQTQPSTLHSIDSPFELIQAGRADAIIVAPPGGLTKNIERGEGRLQLLINAPMSSKPKLLSPIFARFHPR